MAKVSDPHDAGGCPDGRRRGLPPLSALRALDAIGRAGGIRKAAERLEVDHTAVSRQLRGLEAWIGRPLYHRGPAPSLTEVGQRYYSRVARAFEELEAASREAAAPSVGQRLWIHGGPGVPATWLGARLSRFRREHPTIELKVTVGGGRPEGADAGDRIDILYVPGPSASAPPGLRWVELGRPQVFAVASPDYLDRRGLVRAPSDMLHLELLHDHSGTRWQDWLGAHGVPPGGGLAGPVLGQPETVLEYARCGNGVALVDDLHPDRIAGLVRVGPPAQRGFAVQLGAYVLQAPEVVWQDPDVSRFRAWLIASVDPGTTGWTSSSSVGAERGVVVQLTG